MAEQKSMWTTGRILATMVVAVLIATIGWFLISGHSESKPGRLVALPGTPVAAKGEATVPPDFEVPRLDGGTFKLSDYRGKVVVLDFWATWCPPCREGVPQLVRIARDNQARGVEVIGLHIDDRGRSTPDMIQTFVRQYGVNYTVGMASDDMFVAYLGQDETAIPQTLVFDRNGRVVEHIVGYTAADARRLDEAINRAAASR